MTPTVQDAEAAASILLQGWWTSDEQDGPLPIDPFQIARRLGIQVTMARLPAELSGQIAFLDDEEAVISINRDDHPNRQRFTCAHEIGHYTRRTLGGAPYGFVDSRSTLAGLGVDTEEIYANQFAAALLMPASVVEGYVRRALSIGEMAVLLGTSTQAMQLRLRNLRLA